MQYRHVFLHITKFCTLSIDIKTGSQFSFAILACILQNLQGDIKDSVGAEINKTYRLSCSMEI